MRLINLKIYMVWIVAGLSVSATPALAAPDPDRLRAAMIFNFTKFVRWPSNSLEGQKNFRICVADGDSVIDHLQAVQGKKINGFPIAIERFDQANTPCQILVLNDVGEEVPNSAGTLTIGNHSAIQQTNVMISIGIEKKRMVFDIDLTSARKNDLEISAEVLGLARTVR